MYKKKGASLQVIQCEQTMEENRPDLPAVLCLVIPAVILGAAVEFFHFIFCVTIRFTMPEKSILFWKLCQNFRVRFYNVYGGGINLVNFVLIAR